MAMHLCPYLGDGCRLHEALQDLYRMQTLPPIPVNPFPKLTRLFLEYGCQLDLWDNQLVSFIRSTLHDVEVINSEQHYMPSMFGSLQVFTFLQSG